MGLWMATALVVGNMIGTGVYLLPANLAPLGWNAVVGWAITLTGSACLALVFAELSAKLPTVGGPYAFAREAFGRPTAFAVAWSYWISLWVGNAAIAMGGISYLGFLVPGLRNHAGLQVMVAIALVWAFTAINGLGVRAAGRLQIIVAAIKLFPLVLVGALIVVMILMSNEPSATPIDAVPLSFTAMTSAATLTLWAMLGLESATVPSDHIRNPNRTIPVATVLGTGLTGLMYLLVCSGPMLLIPAATIASSSAPLSDFASLHLGSLAGRMVAATATLSALGALNGWILLQGEMPAALARDGVFPAWLGDTTSRGVPIKAHITSSLLLTGALALNAFRPVVKLFEFLILVATTASLVLFLACAAAALKLSMQGRVRQSTGFRLIALVGVIYSIWTLIGAGLEATGWGLALLAMGLPVYAVMSRRRRPDSSTLS
jgi:APA family basic amino acid/polyamine antiporter